MKRAVVLLICTLLSVALIACGDNENVVETPNETVEFTETVSVTEEVEPTEAVVEEVKETVVEVVEETEDTVVTEDEQEVVTEKKEGTNVETDKNEVEVYIYTYDDMSATMFAKSTVNVRDLPDKVGNKLGSLSQNQEVTVTGKCNETGWYRIDYNGSVAYVSNSFLVNEKVEVAPPAETNTPVNNNPPANNGGGQAGTGQYPYYTWIDKDFYFVWYGQSQDDIATKFNFADTDIYCNILKERYPGYPDATAAGISDGKYAPVTYICFLYNDELKQTYPVDVINTYER